MGHTLHRYLVLLLGAFLLSACGAPTTDRVKDGDPIKCFWVQEQGRSGPARRLAIINDEIDFKTDPSRLKKGEVSRLSNHEMEIFIIELEGKGFFKVAKSTVPDDKKYVSVHIPSGDYYVGMSNRYAKVLQTYKDVAEAFTAYWSYGDTRFMTGSSTDFTGRPIGDPAVDFEKQKAEQERKNQERRNKK